MNDEQIDEVVQKRFGNMNAKFKLHFRRAVRDCLSASIADTAGAKPVAHVWRDPKTGSVALTAKAGTEGWERVPVYFAAPPAPSVADAAGASERNALFGRVTDWVNEHRIPFDAQNELFRILSASVEAVAENEQLLERIAELERDIELSQKLR